MSERAARRWPRPPAPSAPTRSSPSPQGPTPARPHLQTVLLVGERDERGRTWIADLIRTCGFQVRVIDGAETAAFWGSPIEAVVLVEAEMPGSPWLARLSVLSSRGVTVIVVTERDSSNLRPLLALGPAEVVFLDEVDRSLARILTSAAIGGRLTHVSRSVASEVRLPPVLGGVLARLVQRVLAPPRSCEDPLVIPANLRQLAGQVGCSYGYLRTNLVQAGIDGPTLLTRLRVVRSVLLRLRHLDTWEKVAAEVGFASGAGLCELFRRATGSGRIPEPSYALAHRLVDDLTQAFGVEVRQGPGPVERIVGRRER